VIRLIDERDSSLRIGGAEDMYDRYEETANAVIKERGRWWAGIHTIYQRAISVSSHLGVGGNGRVARHQAMKAMPRDSWPLMVQGAGLLLAVCMRFADCC